MAGANAVGDLDGLVARLDSLLPVIAAQRAARRAERSRQQEETRAAKEQFVLEAERLAAGNDWRGGVNRFRALLDQWKALPRLDRATDDELWHRFSTARTAYTRRRKAQFAKENEAREAARITKEQLVTEAEALSGSTDWGPTTGAYRDMMARWKAAGPAPRGVDETLWKRFRAAQDTFFAAKQATLNQQDTELRANAEAKEALLVEAEALLPVRDLACGQGGVPRHPAPLVGHREGAAGRRSVRSTAGCGRWRPRSPTRRATAGGGPTRRPAPGPRTPRPSWRRRSPPSSSGRPRPRPAGTPAPPSEAAQSAATYREWLAQAQRAASDFGG